MGKIKEFFELSDSNDSRAGTTNYIKVTKNIKIDNSSFIKYVRYNRDSHILEVTLKSGTFTYNDISLTIADNLTVAASPGKYYADNIKLKRKTGVVSEFKKYIDEEGGGTKFATKIAISTAVFAGGFMTLNPYVAAVRYTYMAVSYTMLSYDIVQVINSKIDELVPDTPKK